MTNRYYNDERGEDFTPTSANIICDDMETLATIKRDFLELLDTIKRHVSHKHVQPIDFCIAEESFDELLISAWNRLEEAYNEAPDSDDYVEPDYPMGVRKP